MAQIDFKKATVKIKDGTTPTPNELTVVIGEGNLTYTERVNREYTLDRGVIYGVRDGDEEPMDVSLEFLWEFLTASTGETPTIEDAFKNRGEASAWVTSGDDPCEPFAVDIEVVYTPDCPGVENETIVLPEFRYEELEHDFDAGSVSVSGKCNAKEATVSRA